MPWKAICSMDERVHFVSLVNEPDETFTVLCERFGISRKTGYKWVARVTGHPTPPVIIAAASPLTKTDPLLLTRIDPPSKTGSALERRKSVGWRGPTTAARCVKSASICLPPQGPTHGRTVQPRAAGRLHHSSWSWRAA